MKYLLWLAAVTSLWAGLGCPAVADSRNVVLFVVDDQGLDAGCYGNRIIKTANLDALAKDGTRFTHAYCTTSSCSPSRSVMLTGLFNHANGQYGLQHSTHHFQSFDNIKSLPVVLGDAGYRTARIGKFHVAPETVYQFAEAIPGNARRPVMMANNCRKFIEAESDKPFFLFFCTADPHRSGEVADELPERPNRFGNSPRRSRRDADPVRYNSADVIVPPFLPDTPACRAELAQYYESVSRIDRGLGRLVEILKQAGKYESTLFIYISDNGIPFPGAKTNMYESGLRLPCIVRNPDANRRGVVNEALVSWVDLMPTILDFTNVDAPDDYRLQGRSFLPILNVERPSGWDEMYASHTFHEVTMYYPMRVVHSGHYKLIWNIAHSLPFPFASDLWESATWQDAWKMGEDSLYGKRTIEAYIHRPEFELYDLKEDPDEVNNLANEPQHQDVLKNLKRKLRDFQKRTNDPWILKWERE